uniref:Peptidase A2 domain-containing protein n=1 Tax=Scylla olivacea TaxID=85551 RepID=A0A0P4VRM7_SCYOL
MSNYPTQAMQTKKRKLEEGTPVLQLMLEPPSVPVKKPRLGAHPRLSVSAKNQLVVVVNGYECSALLDSGSNGTVVFWNMARRLGLITGHEPTAPMLIQLWDGLTDVEVLRLQSITVDLGSGVVVDTPALVYPEWLEPYYDGGNKLLLDSHHLRRGGMVQVFRAGGSDIFVRKPHKLRRKVKKPRVSRLLDVLRVETRHGEKRKAAAMLVDTGTYGLHVSKRHRRLLTEESGIPELPKRVALDIGDGCCLHAEPLEEVDQRHFDFIAGTDLLSKYNAVVNYARHTVTFQVGAQWRRATMMKRHRALYRGNTRRCLKE